MTTNLVSQLIDELTLASTAYYSGAEPLMTDEEFDEKFAYLGSLTKELPEGELRSKAEAILLEDLNLGGELTPVEEVKHEAPMLSLAKADSKEQLEKFAKRLLEAGAKGFKLQLKLDGFALSARYEDGVLKRLATRGTGAVGEDSSFLLTSKDVSIVGLPREINLQGTIELRGELFFTEEQFKKVSAARLKHTGEPFKNSRNAAAGLRLKAQKGLDFPVEFSFAAYGAWDGTKPLELSVVEGVGYKTVDQLLTEELAAKNRTVRTEDLSSFKELFESVEALGELIDGFEAPNDGVVIKPMNEAELLASLGNKERHPVSQVAYKYPTPSFPTEVLAITFSVGKTGRITPRAQLKPVKVMGTVISSVSLHNYAWVEERDVRVGSTVAVTRANKVIPYVSAVLSNPDGAVAPEVPTVCPACEDKLVSEDGQWPPKSLRCTNRDCLSRDIYSLINAVGKSNLDIDGMSNATVEYLHEVGKLNTLADLYKLTLEDLEDSTFGYSPTGNPRKLGEKRATAILERIEASKSLPLHRVLTALSIQALGGRAAKSLVKEFRTLQAVRDATVADIASIEGYGEKRARLIVDGLAHRSGVIDDMLAAGVAFTVEDSPSTGVTLEGLSFAISGAVPAPFANRSAWVEFIESHGGEFHSSPKASTSFMIADAEGSSSKVKKAKSLSVGFMTAEEFTKRFTEAG